MKSESWQAVDAFWARELGVTLDTLTGTHGVCCSVQQIHSGVQLFRKNECLVVAVPQGMLGPVQEATRAVSIDTVFSVNWLEQFFRQDAEKILGPAELAYADSSTFRRVSDLKGRKLTDDDSHSYAALAASLDAREVEQSGFSADRFPAFGAFSNGVLCAAACYSVWEPSIAHIVVATHPDHRRRGFASSSVQSLAEEALSRGLILQWRALSSNSSSLAMAKRFGFRHYCSTLFVRLRGEIKVA
jgi:GNAT superfamily N-acetyltransferase